MKRILIVLMALLMVFAVVSCSSSGISEEECEKRVKEAEQKAEEKANEQAAEDIETYKEFVRYKYILEDITEVPQKVLDSDTAKTDVSIDFSGYTGLPKKFYEAFFGGEEVIVEVDSGSDITVKESGTASGTRNDATFKDIKFEAKKYKIHNRKDDKVIKDVTSPETLTITSGYYKQTGKEEEDTVIYTISMGITVDGVNYSVEYTETISGKEYTYSNASVNGKAVVSDLIIAEDLDDGENFYQYH